MTQGKFSKEEAEAAIEAVTEVFDSMPKKKKIEFLGHANDIFLFLEAAKREAPSEKGDVKNSLEVKSAMAGKADT